MIPWSNAIQFPTARKWNEQIHNEAIWVKGQNQSPLQSYPSLHTSCKCNKSMVVSGSKCIQVLYPFDTICHYILCILIRNHDTHWIWVYWCLTSHATIFQSYMWRHRCAGGLKKLNLRSGSQRHWYFAGFFNVPVLHRHGTNLFIRWFRHTAPLLYILAEVSFHILTTWWVSLLVDQGVPEGTCSQVLRSTPVDS